MSNLYTIEKQVRCFLAPIADILLRFVVAMPFFLSGLTKWTYIKNDQLDTLYFLFEDYNIPFLPVKLAAWMATAGELVLPILLVLGLFTRFSALGLLVMTGMIYLADQNPHAIYWAVICFYFIVNGVGKISINQLFFKKVSFNGRIIPCLNFFFINFNYIFKNLIYG